jgi:glycosyltransferase involved in cell wall biosynthesis
MPRVSVGLPVYNGERYLRISIESILAQTYADFELIITDNASTDSTERICREYAAIDKRVRYYRNENNIGAPRNFNLAFELSRGEYLKWATSDDYVASEMIEKCLEVLDKNPTVVLCYPNAKLIDAEGTFIENYDDVLNLQDPIASHRLIQLLNRIKLAHQHLGLIRSAALKRTSLLGSHIAADINLLAELSLYGKFYELPEYLLFRRFHPGSSSWDRSRARQLEYSDPGRVRVRLDSWEAHGRFFAAVQNCPAPFRDKLAMYRFLFHRVFWQKDTLGRELVDACSEGCRHLLGQNSILRMVSMGVRKGTTASSRPVNHSGPPLASQNRQENSK